MTTTTTKPELTVLNPEPADISRNQDLEARVSDRKRELVAELIEHKKRSGLASVEAVDAIKRRLTQLEHLVKQNISDGWMNISEAARAKFELWIDR